MELNLIPGWRLWRGSSGELVLIPNLDSEAAQMKSLSTNHIELSVHVLPRVWCIINFVNAAKLIIAKMISVRASTAGHHKVVN